MMAVLAQRNLRRGLALGPAEWSGHGEVLRRDAADGRAAQAGASRGRSRAALNASGALLLKKTPLWYYILREAAVLKLASSSARSARGSWPGRSSRILKRDATRF